MTKGRRTTGGKTLRAFVVEGGLCIVVAAEQPAEKPSAPLWLREGLCVVVEPRLKGTASLLTSESRCRKPPLSAKADYRECLISERDRRVGNA